MSVKDSGGPERGSTNDLSRDRDGAFRELPGLHGIRYRQYDGEAIPLFKSGDAFWKKPQLRFHGYVKIFDMSKTEDIDEFNRILENVSLRKSVLCTERVVYDWKRGTYMVYLRWIDYFLVHPENSVRLPYEPGA